MPRPTVVHPLPLPESPAHPAPMSSGGATSRPTSAQHPAAETQHPGGLSPQQEAFCAFYVETGNGAQSAIRAGYRARSARFQASRLLTKDNILAKIAALRADLGAGNRIDRATLLAKLERAYHRALADGRPLAAVRAVELQARLTGLLAPRAAAAPSPPLPAQTKGGATGDTGAQENFPGAPEQA